MKIGCHLRSHFTRNYLISWIIFSFWLVLNYDLLEDRHRCRRQWQLLLLCRIKLIGSMLPHSRRPKYGKNIGDTLGCASSASFFLFSSHFDVTCDLSPKRSTAIYNPFVKNILPQSCLLSFNHENIYAFLFWFFLLRGQLSHFDAKQLAFFYLLLSYNNYIKRFDTWGATHHQSACKLHEGSKTSKRPKTKSCGHIWFWACPVGQCCKWEQLTVV